MSLSPSQLAGIAGAPAVLKLTMTGSSTLPHIAERAYLSVLVQNTGPDKAKVSQSVLETAAHLESLMDPLSQPPQLAASAKPTPIPNLPPISHCRKTSLTTSSYYLYSSKGTRQEMEHSSRLQFDIRFRDFSSATLGKFVAELTTMPLVHVNNISWNLMPATERSYRSRLRREATADAIAKARDYCEVLCCGENLRAVSVREGKISQSGSASLFGSSGNNQMQAQMQAQMQMQMQTPRRPGFGTGEGANTELQLQPQSIVMSMDVTVDFVADQASIPRPETIPAKRRSEETGMDEENEMVLV